MCVSSPLKRWLLLLILWGASWTGSHPATAQHQTPRTASLGTLDAAARARIVRHDSLLQFRTRAVPDGRLDTRERVLRAAYRIRTRVPAAGGPEAAARAYLRQAASRFGLDAEAEDLEVAAVQTRPYSRHVTFQQTYQGLPVYNRRIKVSLDRSGQPSMALSGYAPHLTRADALDVQPALSGADARARAEGLVSKVGAETTEPELVVYPARPPRLAWRLVAWPHDAAAEWEVLLDARSGEVIQLVEQSTHLQGKGEGRRGKGEAESGKREEHVHARSMRATVRTPVQTGVQGSGLVFDPDPLTTAGAFYDEGGFFVDADDADAPELERELIEVPLRDITRFDDGLHRLQGPHVQIVENLIGVADVPYAPPAEADPDAFRYTRSDDRFEAVMAYYHIDKSQRYVQELGFDDVQNLRIPVNPQGEPIDNSAYYPALNAISFGTGGVDDAEDADVIWHEYGHALLEAGAPNLLQTSEGRALHEGWADYWAASYARSLIEEGTVPAADWRQIYTWDGHNEFWPGRYVEHAGAYPNDTFCDVEGPEGPFCDIYEDGLLWATALMEIYDDLGRAVTDRLNLASHGYLIAPATMRDAAEALLQADLDYFGGSHLSVLLDRLGGRGFVNPAAHGPFIAYEPLFGTEQRGSVRVGEAIAIEAMVARLSVSIEEVRVQYQLTSDAPTQSIALRTVDSSRYSGRIPAQSQPGLIRYYIEAVDAEGRWTRQPAAAPDEVFEIVVAAELANFPNPFTNTTEISYVLPEPAATKLELYDLLGRRVTVLVDEEQESGAYTLPFDGSGLASGVYVLRLQAGDVQQTQRVVVTR